MNCYNYRFKKSQRFGDHRIESCSWIKRKPCLRGSVLIIILFLLLPYCKGSAVSRIALYSTLVHLRDLSNYFKTVANTRRTSIRTDLLITNLVSYKFVFMYFVMTLYTWWICLLLNQSGDIHPNPGPLIDIVVK